jgi:hypothetical protein
MLLDEALLSLADAATGIETTKPMTSNKPRITVRTRFIIPLSS